MVSGVWLRYCVIILKSTSALTHLSARLKGIACAPPGWRRATARTPRIQCPRFLISVPCHYVHQQNTKVTPGHAPCSLCVRRSRCRECKLASWVCGLLLGAWGQGTMPPGRTRRNQGLRRYRTQKGSPDAEWFSGRKPIG